MNPYFEAAQALAAGRNITVLTGAGISTASGIPDFRSQDGLYKQNLGLEDILSEGMFQQDPVGFWNYYKDIFNIKLSQAYEPNQGHHYLRQLELEGKTVNIFTQNVDGLHRKAGNTSVYELHGTIEKAHCLSCRREFPLSYIQKEAVPECSHDSTILKPDVVLFGGAVKHMDRAYGITCQSDVFITLGTSLNVYPAKEIPRYIQHARNIVKIIINKEPTASDYLFDIVLHEDISEALAKIDAEYKKISALS